MLVLDFLAIPVPIFDACIGFILIGMDLEICVGGFIFDDVRAFVVFGVSKREVPIRGSGEIIFLACTQVLFKKSDSLVTLLVFIAMYFPFPINLCPASDGFDGNVKVELFDEGR